MPAFCVYKCEGFRYNEKQKSFLWRKDRMIVRRKITLCCFVTLLTLLLTAADVITNGSVLTARLPEPAFTAERPRERFVVMNGAIPPATRRRAASSAAQRREWS